MVKKKYLFYTAVLISGMVLLAGCNLRLPWGATKPYKETRFMMDTIVEITAYGPKGEKAVKAAFDEMNRVNDLMTMYNPSSEVSTINNNAGKQAVKVSPETLFVIERTLYFSKLSDGAFDPTVGPLTLLWGIGVKDKYIPSQEEISRLLPLVDYRNVIVDHDQSTVKLAKEGMVLDLGGVAKGYAVDRAWETLKQYGITSAIINAGGDIRVIGKRPDGKPWQIGVQHPRQSEDVIAQIPIDNWTIVTSGDYQRYFESNGIRYHHILQPQTGQPARALISVTITSPNSTDADLLSTAVFVLGPEKGMELVESLPDIGAIMVTPDGKVLVSSRIKDQVQVLDGK